MINIAQFRIIGRIGSIRTFDKVTHLSIASDRPNKDESGNWTTHTNWNDVTILSSKMRKRLEKESVSRHGNLVIVEGSIQSNAYEKEGKKVYDTSLIAQEFSVLSFAKQAD